jgi:hypothetical protein
MACITAQHSTAASTQARHHTQVHLLIQHTLHNRHATRNMASSKSTAAGTKVSAACEYAHYVGALPDRKGFQMIARMWLCCTTQSKHTHSKVQHKPNTGGVTHVDIAEHARQLLLHQLEGCQRGAELTALAQVPGRHTEKQQDKALFWG